LNFINASLNNHLHIVTHDVPFPMDFGGVTDLFCKIKAFHQVGYKIHLHCFVSKRPQQDVLHQYCASINYYQRSSGPGFIFSGIPFIVYSRSNKELLSNLKKDNAPILLEGVHCSYFLYRGLLKNRKVFLRLHNVEYLYYRNLAHHEKHLIKRLYYRLESILLKKYEKQLSAMAPIWAVSQSDRNIYMSLSDNADIHFLPVFLPWNEVKSQRGKGTYCLYHGNLSVSENQKAVHWLLDEVFCKLKLPLVIAGKNPSPTLKEKIYRYDYCCLIENPDEHEMQDLITKAQLHVLPSFNQTGVKLKLLNALFNGRHCLVNDAAAEGTEMNGMMHIANDAAAFTEKVTHLFNEVFTEEMFVSRAEQFKDSYDNEANIQKIRKWL